MELFPLPFEKVLNWPFYDFIILPSHDPRLLGNPEIASGTFSRSLQPFSAGYRATRPAFRHGCRMYLLMLTFMRSPIPIIMAAMDDPP